MKRFLLIACMLSLIVMQSCVPAQKIAKETTLETLTKESTVEVQKEYVSQSYVSNVSQSVIDTLKEVNLPVEKSEAKIPKIQRSDLETSLAKSSAWIDSSGLLNHRLENKETAKLNQRISQSDRATIRADSVQKLRAVIITKDSLLQLKNKESPAKPIHKERLLEGLFYKSGVFAWFAILVVVLWWMQVKTKVKPLTWIYSLIKKLIFKK